MSPTGRAGYTRRDPACYLKFLYMRPCDSSSALELQSNIFLHSYIFRNPSWPGPKSGRLYKRVHSPLDCQSIPASNFNHASEVQKIIKV